MADATPDTPVAADTIGDTVPAAPAATSQAVEDDEFTFESTTDKKYPLCPEGVHKVIVDKALFEMRDPHPQAKSPAKVPTISLWLSTKDAKYEDPKAPGEMRAHRLFYSMKVSDFKDPKTKMPAFFQKVCGTPVPLKETKNDDGTISKRIYLGPRTTVKMEESADEIHYPQFEQLEFAVNVAHEEKDDGTKKDKVDSIIACTPEEKAMNAKLFATA